MSVITHKKLILKENDTHDWTIMCREPGSHITELNIPSVAFGEGIVSRIAHQAFEKDVFLECVRIPSSIEKIGHEAFAECHHLFSLFFYDGKSKILLRTKSFAKCDKIQTILINRPVVLERSVFEGCEKLSSVSGLFTTIGPQSFANCNNLEVICFGCSTSIADDAFVGCNNLKELVFLKELNGSVQFMKQIPKTVKIKCPANSKLMDLGYEGYCVEELT